MKRMKVAGVVLAAAGMFAACSGDPAEAAPLPQFRMCPAQPTCDQQIQRTVASIGDDSYGAVCAFLEAHVSGYPAADRDLFVGVAAGLAHNYGITFTAAVRVELYQISVYCPTWLYAWQAATA